jgi:hypothetical protein
MLGIQSEDKISMLPTLKINNTTRNWVLSHRVFPLLDQLPRRDTRDPPMVVKECEEEISIGHLYSRNETGHLFGLILRSSYRVEAWSGLGLKKWYKIRSPRDIFSYLGTNQSKRLNFIIVSWFLVLSRSTSDIGGEDVYCLSTRYDPTEQMT